MVAYKAEEELISQPNWGGKLLSMRYFAAQGDATRLVDGLLKTEDPILERPMLTAARWLREAPETRVGGAELWRDWRAFSRTKINRGITRTGNGGAGDLR